MAWIYFVTEFISKWIEKGRFPREELRMRTSIAVVFGITLLALGVAYVIHVVAAA